MSVEFSVYQAELVFTVNPQVEHSKILDALELVRDKTEEPLESTSSAPDKWQITFGDSLVRLHFERDAALDVKLRITARLLDRASAEDMEDRVQRTLARVTAAMAKAFNAESVLWLKRDTSFQAVDFIASVMGEEAAQEFSQAQKATASVAAEAVQPRRVTLRSARTRRRPIPAGMKMQATERMRMHYQLSEDADDDASGTEEQQLSVPLRLTAWAMTIMVSVFSVPLAWVLFAYNLNRGTDFRATAHVLALISSFSVLHSAGGTAQVYQMLFG